MGAGRVVFLHIQLNIHNNNKGILTGRTEGLYNSPSPNKTHMGLFLSAISPLFYLIYFFFFSVLSPSLSTRFYQQFRISLSSNSEHTTSREKKVLSPYTVYMFKDKMDQPSTTASKATTRTLGNGVPVQNERMRKRERHRREEEGEKERERDMTPE